MPFRRRCAILTLIAIMMTVLPATGQTRPAPVSVQAAVFLKLIAFHKTIAVSDSVTVHVVGASDFAAQLSEGLGSKIGNGVLSKVTSGSGLPAKKPSVLYIGDASKVRELTEYTRELDVLSISGLIELIGKGVTLTVGVESSKLKVYYNAQSAELEEATWEAGFFKVVENK